MRDVDALIAALEGPSPPEVAPVWPRRRVWPAAVVVGLAAAALVEISLPHSSGMRGQPARATVDLRMVAVRGGVAVRVTDTAYHPGERVYFRLATSTPADVWLWVDGPGGREPIAATEATPAGHDLGDANGLVAYDFDRPGTYVFAASTQGQGACPCVTQAVEVK